MNIKKAVTICAAEQGMSKSDVAERAGISRSTLSRMMAKNSCSIPMLARIAAALDVKMSYLMDKGGA